MIAQLVAAALASQALHVDVARLAWLSGHWRTEERGQWTEELWSSAEGGTLIGINRSVRGDRTTGFEYMRIAADGQGTAFFGSPSGAAPVRFAMVEVRRNHAAFENRGHDYPQRIVYRRDGNVLVATVSLADGSRPMSWTFRRRP